MDTETPTPEAESASPRLQQLGPRKRWWILALGAGCVVAILAAHRLTAHSFEHGHWTVDEGSTGTTTVEIVWYVLPSIMIVLVATTFLVGPRWWVPEKGTRSKIRAIGFLVSLFAVLISFGCISTWFYVQFYMD